MQQKEETKKAEVNTMQLVEEHMAEKGREKKEMNLPELFKVVFRSEPFGVFVLLMIIGNAVVIASIGMFPWYPSILASWLVPQHARLVVALNCSLSNPSLLASLLRQQKHARCC